MRPAQLTPENLGDYKTTLSICSGFNEAGAINAGKQYLCYRDCEDDDVSMRPAQLTPENPSIAKLERMAQGLVSMRPAQLTPENHLDEMLESMDEFDVSMRPAQLTPENESCCGSFRAET